MEHSAITVLARLRPEADVRLLDRRLKRIGGRLSRRNRRGADPDFAGIEGLHFLRLLIIRDPDRGPNRWRLLMGAVIDRDDVDAFYRRLAEVTPDLDALWGECEGYRGSEHFVEFMGQNAIRPAAFYQAFKDERATDLRRYDSLRRRWKRLRQSSQGCPDLPSGRFSRLGRGILDRVRRMVGLPARIWATLRDGAALVQSHGWGPAWAAATTIVRGLNRYPGWRWFNLLTGNLEMPRRPRLSGILPERGGSGESAPDLPGFMEAGSHLPSVEDRVMQNQLTLVTPIANAARMNQLGAVLGAVDSYARIWARPGELLGMSTIHFVRWMPIDDGRRLLMLSDYDHSWEAYIDEFIEMIRTGMDAIWSSASRTGERSYKAGVQGEYLPDYLVNGSGDAAAFKQFLRRHQANAEVFYSAYPGRTVLHTREDRLLFKGVTLGLCDAEFLDRVMENERHVRI